MKTRMITIAIIVAAIVVAGAAAWYFLVKPPQSGSTDVGVTVSYGQKDACTYLTQQVADTLLGAGAEKGTQNEPTSSNDVSVSTCVYTSKTDGTLAGIKNMKSATLLVRAPLTSTGAASNETPFEQLKSGAEEMSGYGERAFWDAELGQLNVLKNGMWLIMSNGPATTLERTLDDAKAMADLIVPGI